MQTKFILLLLIWGCFSCSPIKKTEKSSIIYDETQVSIPRQAECPVLIDTFISIGNTVVHYNAVQDVKNLIMKFNYDVKTSGTDSPVIDLPEGIYLVEYSKGLEVMLEYIKNNIVKRFDACLKKKNFKYLSVKITGNADATPIRNITYQGEFGQNVKELCLVNRTPKMMEVIKDQSISENYELAFLRSVAGREYFKNNIFTDKNMQPAYILEAFANTQRGGEFRRVVIEMVIPNYFK
jgi:hypothetical protein